MVKATTTTMAMQATTMPTMAPAEMLPAPEGAAGGGVGLGGATTSSGCCVTEAEMVLTLKIFSKNETNEPVPTLVVMASDTLPAFVSNVSKVNMTDDSGTLLRRTNGRAEISMISMDRIKAEIFFNAELNCVIFFCSTVVTMPIILIPALNFEIHGFIRQVDVCIVTLQDKPPLMGSTSTVRERVIVPAPHAAEQELKLLQGDITQFTDVVVVVVVDLVVVVVDLVVAVVDLVVVVVVVDLVVVVVDLVVAVVDLVVVVVIDASEGVGGVGAGVEAELFLEP